MATTQFKIPTGAEASLELEIEAGDTLFVLGANGSGKSALIQRLFAQGGATAIRIAAHRANYFQVENPGLSPHERETNEQNYRNADVTPDARWKDDYSQVRNYASLYDLVASVNARARDIASAFDANDIPVATARRAKPSNLTVLNQLLRLSNISVQITIDERSRVMASRSNGAPYSVARMSDGERNALLLICDVLNAKSGSLLVIDEPERHLHHSIISPLLTMLFSRRSDLAFVVATHDVSLPLSRTDAKTLLVRGCQISAAGAVEAWDCDLVSGEVPEDIKADVLGSRRKILYVEGNNSTSLDRPLYATVFPNVSVVPKDSCNDIEHCVKGVSQTKEMNWLTAHGIVDGDFINETKKQRLQRSGIFALPFYSVESLYYDPLIQARLARRKATDEAAAAANLARAAERTVKKFSDNLDRLARRSVETKIREQIGLSTPGQAAIETLQPINISVDVQALVAAEMTSLAALVANVEVTKLITHYPVRETGALDEISRALGYKSRKDYENAVLTALLEDEETLGVLKQLLGDAYHGIAHA
jgi:ABC-type cobalamin transport system ATPase subunit